MTSRVLCILIERLKSGARRTALVRHFNRRTSSGDVIHPQLRNAGSGYEAFTCTQVDSGDWRQVGTACFQTIIPFRWSTVHYIDKDGHFATRWILATN